jgi:DhnA family fructose-bisphosphate aldolase class Ia
MSSKQYRMSELLDPADGRSLVIDTSRALSLGVLPGLEHFMDVVKPLLPLLDGIVASPGQARALKPRTRREAALLVRADWTNALRGEDFVLPAETIQYLPLLDPVDALDLGANALVMYFILGHEEEIEARCMQRVVNLALEGLSLGVPVLVEVKPVGPRVVLRDKAIELGASFAIEGGADGIIVPWPGAASFKTILAMGKDLQVWVGDLSLEKDATVMEEALQMGASGIWLDERVFALKDPAASLQTGRSLVHGKAVR